MNPIQIEAHGHSRPSSGRERRRDQFAIAALRTTLQLDQGQLASANLRREGRTESRVLVLTDELEATRAARRASRAAVDGLVAELLDGIPWKHLAAQDADEAVPSLRESLQAADERVRRRSGLGDLGQLVRSSLAFLAGPHLYVAAAGDAPVYLLRDGKLQHLGRADACGAQEGISVQHLEPQTGDVLALLSAGAARRHTHASLSRVLRSGLTPRAMALRLVGGGPSRFPRTAVAARCYPTRGEAVVDTRENRPELDARRPVPAPPLKSWPPRRRPGFVPAEPLPPALVPGA